MAFCSTAILRGYSSEYVDVINTRATFVLERGPERTQLLEAHLAKCQACKRTISSGRWKKLNYKTRVREWAAQGFLDRLAEEGR